LQRVFVAASWCGNITHTQLIGISSPQPLLALPQDRIISCSDSSSPSSTGSAIVIADYCNLTPVVNYTDTVILLPNSPCGEYDIVRHWTASDRYNTVSGGVQHIRVRDSAAPVVTQSNTLQSITAPMCPSAQNAVQWEQYFTPPTIRSSCALTSQSILIGFTDSITVAGCSSDFQQLSSITRTWVASSFCSAESSNTTQVLNVAMPPPVITLHPPTHSPIPCGANVAPGAGWIAFPNVTFPCPASPHNALLYSDQPQAPFDCQLNGVTVVRTWTAFTICGPSASTQQMFAIAPTNVVAPVAIDNPPATPTLMQLTPPPPPPPPPENQIAPMPLQFDSSSDFALLESYNNQENSLFIQVLSSNGDIFATITLQAYLPGSIVVSMPDPILLQTATTADPGRVITRVIDVNYVTQKREIHTDATLCFTGAGGKNTNNKCLGYINPTTQRWQCQVC
jgi:hypothetical protein